MKVGFSEPWHPNCDLRWRLNIEIKVGTWHTEMYFLYHQELYYIDYANDGLFIRHTKSYHGN